MKSYIATTHQVFSPEEAAGELLRQVQKFPLDENNLGIIYCDSEMEDLEDFIQHLHEQLPFDTIGCTTIATFNNRDQFSEMSITLLILSSDDCTFHVALSDCLNKDNAEAVIEKTYYKAMGTSDEPPSMLLAFPPYNLEIMLDTYPDVLSKLSVGAPVFGGISASNDPYGKNAILFNGRLYADKFVLVLIKGNLHPLFSIGVELSRVSSVKHRITKADKNTIFTVDDKPFSQYLEEVGLPVEKLATDETNVVFVSNPLILTDPDNAKRIIRTMHELNLRDGYGVCIGLTPEGYKIAIGSLTKKDIASATEKAVRYLLDQVNERQAKDSSYQYTTILASSCIGRFLVMTPTPEIEQQVLHRFIPDHMNYAGFFGYGEIGPTSYDNGVACNTAQNVSLLLCAI